jgi:hypothetical protein
MSVGVMEDYKLSDLRASHTLGWSTLFVYYVGRGTGTPKNNEVNKIYSLKLFNKKDIFFPSFLLLQWSVFEDPYLGKTE